MKKRCLISIFILLFCSLFIFNNSAVAKIYIDIGSPSFKQIPVAICDFKNKTTSTDKAVDSGITVSDNIRKDLSLTGIFNILNKKSFLEDKTFITSITAEKIFFPDWTAIGADYLLLGNITQNDKEIIADSFFFDVTRGELIFNKKYHAEADKLKEISRAIASDIMLALVNDEGDFNTKIAFVSKKGPKSDIQIINYDGSELKSVTNHQSIIIAPRWSPDGQRISFVSNRSGSPQIYTMDADGNNVKRITYEGTYNTSPSWSPHGDRIAYEGLTKDKYQIFSIDADGNNPSQLTFDAANNKSPSWSPSGRQIVYVSQKNSKSKIIIVNSNGSNPRVLYEYGTKSVMPVWSPRFK
ncbi:MAG: DUF5050 domain-containing protein [Smithella sp.]